MEAGTPGNPQHAPLQLIWSKKALGILETDPLDIQPTVQRVGLPTICHYTPKELIDFGRNNEEIRDGSIPSSHMLGL